MPWVSKAPSPEVQERVDLFNLFRGGFLASFAQVEFTMGRMLSRFNDTPPFEGSFDKPKFKVEGRVDAFQEFFESRSELKNYSEQATQLCNKMREKIELRHFLAHGLVRFDVSANHFTVRRIQPSSDDPWNEIEIDIPADVLPNEISKMGLFAQEFMYFAREVSENYSLEF